MTAATPDLRIGLVGYGEAGKIFAEALIARYAGAVSAWDIAFRDPAVGSAAIEHARLRGIRACGSIGELLAASSVVISAVTASNALAVAQEAAPSIGRGSYFLDVNSASPGTKQDAARLIDGAGAHYVEAGVMTSVPPYGIRVPMLWGGPRAQALSDMLSPVGMDVTVVSTEIGVASAIKMCRSVMIKGLEAIVIESLSTARRYGVEREVLTSLAETFPSIDWDRQASYLFSRVIKHGRRRAEEMREAAQTVAEAGYQPVMSAAIAEKQDWVARLTRADAFRELAETFDWRDAADSMSRALGEAGGKPEQATSRRSA